jgi:hypothetical protein
MLSLLLGGRQRDGPGGTALAAAGEGSGGLGAVIEPRICHGRSTGYR